MKNKTIGKRERLSEAIASLIEEQTEDSIFELIVSSYQALKPDSGLIWSEVEKIIAKEFSKHAS